VLLPLKIVGVFVRFSCARFTRADKDDEELRHTKVGIVTTETDGNRRSQQKVEGLKFRSLVRTWLESADA
jgi:hypothetical protein